ARRVDRAGPAPVAVAPGRGHGRTGGRPERRGRRPPAGVDAPAPQRQTNARPRGPGGPLTRMPEKPRGAMEGHQTQHISSEHPRVMVVDGSKVVRKLIEQLLRADLPGVEVLSCESAAEAKRQLESGAVDLITTALRLPDMDGLDLARYVR